MDTNARRREKQSLRWLFVCALSMVFACRAHAQDDVTTTSLDIRLSGKGCEEIREIWVVIQGEDAESTWRPARFVENCHWTATAVRRFSTEYAFFSLRFDDARTECHKSEAVFPATGDPYAKLAFDCCISKPFRQVTLAPTPSMPISYMRLVSEKVPGIPKHTDSRPCIEYGTFEEPGTIGYLQYGAEELFLQPGLARANKKMTALNINVLPEVQKGKSISLTADDIRHRLGIQRLKGYRSAPRLPLTAMELDADYLKRLELKTLRVTGK